MTVTRFTAPLMNREPTMMSSSLSAHGRTALALALAIACGQSAANDRPAPHAGMLPAGTPAALEALDNARRGEAAIAAWRQGFRNGDFSPLIAMFDDNVEYRLGIAPYNVIRRGKADATEALRYFQALNIRVEQAALTPPMFNSTTTTFEFAAKGSVGAVPVEANLLVVFEFLNGKIVRLREYTAPP